MIIEIVHGLTVAKVTADEALATDWAGRRGEADLVRVTGPGPADRPALLRAGFTVHPAWITWIAPAGPSEEALVAGLSVNARRAVRSGQRYVAEHGIRMKTVAPLDEESYDAFLGLYDHQIGAMRHGVPFARLDRDDVLAHAADYFAVRAVTAGGVLAGGCVCRIARETSTVVIRFVTALSDSRQQGIVRVMYLQAFRTARELGCRDVSLGTDPALYGHIAKPGLFRFKSGLRFAPIPSRFFGGAMDDLDEATRVLRTDALSDPSLLVRYHLPEDDGTPVITRETPLGLDVITPAPAPDLSPYDAPFVHDIRARRPG